MIFEASRAKAIDKLNSFVENNLSEYSKLRNFDFGPDKRSNISCLSPYITHGIINELEVIDKSLKKFSFTKNEKFIQEILWRVYWKGWLELRPNVWTDFLNELKKIREEFRENNNYKNAIEGKTNIEYTLNKTEYSGHAIDLVRSCDVSKYDSVCAVGGDGTLYEVLNGMLTRDDNMKIPIGLIPGGTGNSFMKTIDCLDPVDAINKILSNMPMSIDVMKVSTSDKKYYSLNLVGWGMATDISVFAEKLRIIGGQRYNIASIFEIIKNKKRIYSR